MAALDQLKEAAASAARFSFAMAALDQQMRRALAPTALNVADVVYWPVPVRLALRLATQFDVAMSPDYAQRLLNRLWLAREARYGDEATLNVGLQDIVAHLVGERDTLNRTFGSAVVTAELPTGLTLLVDMHCRPARDDASQKQVSVSMFLPTPQGAADYLLYGELDQRDGVTNLTAHVETEAVWQFTVDDSAGPLALAHQALLCVLSGVPGLDQKALDDVSWDLQCAAGALEAVRCGDNPDRHSVRAEVTRWRETR